MEIEWDEEPVPDGPFFTRDLYDTYSLAPHIRELLDILQSPAVSDNIKQDCIAAAEGARSPNIKGAAKLKGNGCVSGSQASSWENCDSDDPSSDDDAEGTESKGGRKSKRMETDAEVDAPYPEPRLPYPRMSSLSAHEQKAHVGYMLSNKTRSPTQGFKTRLNNEVAQFMTYLQDVAKMCADDYKLISPGAVQYTEELFRAYLEWIKTLPQFYQIHEMTSLTGGTFNPGLALTFEKQLLTMGSVSVTDHKMVPADVQLASDYQSVSSLNPPAIKARHMHAMVSNDGNAEKLSSFYEPHVCLSREALVRLLDNHGPEFGEPWELPVVVKINPGKVSSKKKIVYIDSPLLKTEMTVRERSHIYHEESLKLSIVKSGSVNVFRLMTEHPTNEQQISPEGSKRKCVSAESTGLDFEVDLTDLETFGDISKMTKTKKKKNQEDEGIKSKKVTCSSVVTRSKSLSEHHNANSSSQEDTRTSQMNTEAPSTESSELVVREAISPKTKQICSAKEEEEIQTFTEDSDEEKLIIDDYAASAKTVKQPEAQTTKPSTVTPVPPAPESTALNTDSSTPHKCEKTSWQTKQAKSSGDQLGEILRMQTAMFQSSNDTPATATKSPSRCVGLLPNSHATSLVKPCVTSYLERNQNEDGSTCAAYESAVFNKDATEHKKILSEDLQACAEDEQDYEAPAEGNLLYKLYSLQDLLLLVRSSVSLTHTRNVGNNQNQHVPVHVLPKLEYQLCYGVECLTSSEACHLWTETLLHSTTASYIAHINALTSKVPLLRKLPDDWKQSITCGFKSSKSLNILHHLLKKLIELEEGQYLITHKAGEPFVTILKAVNGKASRGAYNLQEVHSSVPQPPSSGLVPWVPVDSAVVLPFHRKHGQIPCTFPPKPFLKTGKERANNPGAGQNNQNAQGSKKKSKRSAKRNKYFKRLIQKSV
ncbi:little elongation complex subunit 2 [Nematolebias whitei]|uniref:little elongation complex subunit 2 n=1 Tax=Nematolebias whitei TaxID=451745 RepID=UPI00189BCF0A|nr:little elongation complex subunit 2 [Nematolebias whitei]